MTTYSELTTAQKTKIAQAEKYIRGAISSLVAFADQADFNLKEAYWNSEIQPILNTLAANEVIPNTSSLAGAADVTRAQLEGAKNWLFGIQSDIDGNLTLVVKLIGINSGSGGA